ncbi:RNA polymerase-associated protein LEO1 [Drosophila santomea]|uniref:RNA polymerase-associated protein LEO1 n=1 Tax=Drosophila santomea TaxID=129105 RepID=UPI001953EC55|nr:RNA polymerase-associated protein LEO1 [Drosophila santomea]
MVDPDVHPEYKELQIGLKKLGDEITENRSIPRYMSPSIERDENYIKPSHHISRSRSRRLTTNSVNAIINHETDGYAESCFPMSMSSTTVCSSGSVKSPYDLNAQTSSSISGQSDAKNSSVSSSTRSIFKFESSGSESKSSSSTSSFASTSSSSKSALTPNEQNVENNVRDTLPLSQNYPGPRSINCSNPNSFSIISNEAIPSTSQIGGMGERDDQGSIDSEVIHSIRESTSLIELKDNSNTIIDEDHNQEYNIGGNVLPTGPISCSNFDCQPEESIPALTFQGMLPTQIYRRSLSPRSKEVSNGASNEKELELCSMQYSSTMMIENQHYGEQNDMEQDLRPLQNSLVLPPPSQSMTEILNPRKVPFTPSSNERPNSNFGFESNGANYNQEKTLSELRYSTDPMGSNDLAYASSDSLDIVSDFDDNPDNQQPGREVNAYKKSPEKELFSNSGMQVLQVLDISHSVEGEQRKMFGKEVAVKFQSTIPTDNCGLLKGPTHFLKMPSFIPVESKPYVPQTFENRMTKDDLKDEQAREDFLNRLKATVRWREDENKVKESNSKIVRWSDGSETFHVGDEVFDVMHHPVTDNQNHLYVRLASCYQPQGTIKDKMTLRPMLDSSFGQSHVQGLRNRTTNKPQQGCVKVIMDMGSNPEQDQERLMKQELAMLRQEERGNRRERIKNRHLKRGKSGTFQEDDSVDGEANFEDEDMDKAMGLEEPTDDYMDDDPSCSTAKSKEGKQSIYEDGFPIGGAIRKARRLVYSDLSSD